MPTLERLYEIYNVLQEAKDDVSKHEKEYAELLNGVKGNPNERQLSSQFITIFFPKFSNYQEKAVNAIFDLCEDDEITIRRQAIKDLPTLCKTKPDLVPKVSDILAQLLQMEDALELATIHSSLLALLKLDCKSTLTGLFYQIENTEDESVKERCLKFILNKIQILGSEVFKTDCEELIMKESKAVLQESSEQDFVAMMGILGHLQQTKTIKGHQHMVDLVSEQINFDESLDPTDAESFHKFASIVKQAVPYFSSQINSTKFVDYMIREVLPHLDDLKDAKISNGDAGVENGTPAGSSLALDLLKTLSECMVTVGTLEKPEEKMKIVFEKLLKIMPLPPSTEETNIESESLEFSRVECLLFILHKLGKSHPEFLTADAERLKDFRTRMQYFARGSQAYQKKLRESLVSEKSDALKGEDNRIKMVALKTTANISAIIKDLFHQPPLFKTTCILSWKTATKTDSEKRHTQISFEEDSKRPRRSFAPRGRGRGGFRSRSYGRGRGGRGYGGSRGRRF